MKATNKAMITKGYISGIGSGMTWGLDAVLLGVVMTMTPFVKEPLLIVGGLFICTFLHDAFAALWMLLFTVSKKKMVCFLRALKTKDALFCIIGALFGGPLAMTFYVIAISKGGPALTATVTACYPLLGSAMAVLILKEKMTARGWLGLLICIAGIIYIGYSPYETGNVQILQGIIFSLIAAVGWATEAVVCGYGMKSGRIDPQIALLIRELTSAITYILFVIPIMMHGYNNVLGGLHLVFGYFPAWGLLLITAFIGMLSFFMWYTSIDLIGASKALCLNVTYSFWAVVFSLIFFGGVVSFHVVVGAILIILGVSIATLVHRKSKKETIS